MSRPASRDLKVKRPRGAKSTVATQADVARAANVSQSAVSRVFAGHGYVAPEVREKIEAAGRRLNYSPNLVARTMAKGRSNIVAVLTTAITHPFVPHLLEQLTLATQARGLDVLLLNVPQGQQIERLVPLAKAYRVKGIIVANVTLAESSMALARQGGTPVVIVNRYAEDEGVHTVSCDNVDGARRIANDMLNAGLRRLAFIGGLATSATNTARRKGFLDKLAERGIAPALVAEGAFSHAWGYEAAGRLKRECPDVDGVFCGDDVVALGVIDGYRDEPNPSGTMPAIVGFDDIPSASWSPYMLTTFRNPLEEMVEAALDMLDLPADARPQRKLLAGTLIRRRSF
ncbi:MAG: LacI family DNA-binding transcriptional regulator [Variovorax sp.]|nr:LacI family DNA-binding transcriptional regulator [Variovorax sp.]